LLEPIPKVEMVQALLSQTFDLTERTTARIDDLSRLARDCACYRLHIGDLAAAATAVRATVSGI
jgi:hypothetical protein